MARHAAQTGRRARTATAEPAHRGSERGAHRAGRHRSTAPPTAPATSGPPRRPHSLPVEISTVESPRSAPRRHRSAQSGRPVRRSPVRVEAAAARTPAARIPAGVWETLGWSGFAVMVALVVIAASDNDVSETALWAAGLGATVVVAFAATVLRRTPQ